MTKSEMLEGLIEDLKLFRKLEWSSSHQGQGSGFMGSGGDGEHFAACPNCGGVNPNVGAEREFANSAIGHKKSCRLKKRIDQLAGELE